MHDFKDPSLFIISYNLGAVALKKNTAGLVLFDYIINFAM